MGHFFISWILPRGKSVTWGVLPFGGVLSQMESSHMMSYYLMVVSSYMTRSFFLVEFTWGGPCTWWRPPPWWGLNSWWILLHGKVLSHDGILSHGKDLSPGGVLPHDEVLPHDKVHFASHIYIFISASEETVSFMVFPPSNYPHHLRYFPPIHTPLQTLISESFITSSLKPRPIPDLHP